MPHPDTAGTSLNHHGTVYHSPLYHGNGTIKAGSCMQHMEPALQVAARSEKVLTVAIKYARARDTECDVVSELISALLE